MKGLNKTLKAAGVRGFENPLKGFLTPYALMIKHGNKVYKVIQR